MREIYEVIDSELHKITTISNTGVLILPMRIIWRVAGLKAEIRREIGVMFPRSSRSLKYRLNKYRKCDGLW